MTNLHPDDEALFCAVEKACFIVASQYHLPLKEVEPKRRPLAQAAIGLCYIEEGRISITFRYRQHKEDGGQWWNRPFPTHEVLNTAAHELAHLRYRGETKEHKAYTAILEKEITQLFI